VAGRESARDRIVEPQDLPLDVAFGAGDDRPVRRHERSEAEPVSGPLVAAPALEIRDGAEGVRPGDRATRGVELPFREALEVPATGRLRRRLFRTPHGLGGPAGRRDVLHDGREARRASPGEDQLDRLPSFREAQIRRHICETGDVRRPVAVGGERDRKRPIGRSEARPHPRRREAGGSQGEGERQGSGELGQDFDHILREQGDQCARHTLGISPDVDLRGQDEGDGRSGLRSPEGDLDGGDVPRDRHPLRERAELGADPSFRTPLDAGLPGAVVVADRSVKPALSRGRVDGQGEADHGQPDRDETGCGGPGGSADDTVASARVRLALHGECSSPVAPL